MPTVSLTHPGNGACRIVLSRVSHTVTPCTLRQAPLSKSSLGNRVACCDSELEKEALQLRPRQATLHTALCSSDCIHFHRQCSFQSSHLARAAILLLPMSVTRRPILRFRWWRRREGRQPAAHTSFSLLRVTHLLARTPLNARLAITANCLQK